MGSYTGTVPTFLAGEILDADKLTEVSLFMTAATAAWTTFTPTWTASGTAPAIGNSTVKARYRRLGDTVEMFFYVQFGNTATFGTGTYSFALPVATSEILQVGPAIVRDLSGTADRPASCWIATATTFQIITSSGVAGQTVPWTWANTDFILAHMQYYV